MMAKEIVNTDILSMVFLPSVQPRDVVDTQTHNKATRVPPPINSSGKKNGERRDES